MCSQAAPTAAETKKGLGVRQLFNRHFNLLIGTISVGGTLLLWQYARALGIPGLAFVDPPTAIIAASADLLQSATFWTPATRASSAYPSASCWRSSSAFRSGC